MARLFYIMTRTKLYARTSALPAIAAALALSSTPSLAQEVQPTEPVPVTTTAPPVTADTSSVTADTSVETPVAAETPAKTATVKTRTVTHTTRTAAAKPAPSTARAATTRTTSTRATTTAAAPASAATPSQAPANASSQSAVAPVVDMTAKPANQPATASKASNGTNQSLIYGAGALALIALGAAAFAVARRRRREDAWHGEWADEPGLEHEATIERAPAAAAAPMAVEPRHDPIVHREQPEIVEPSAFSWGATAPASPETQRDADDDRLPGETWVQRAYRGPSANNPSVSLKNRLRRAAFFDKRERDVAAGLAEPVDPDAGLPAAMADETERELA